MFKLKIKFIFFFFLTFKSFASEYISNNALKSEVDCKLSSFENLSYLSPGSEIHVRIPKSSKWNQNLLAAFLENKSYIISKYKKTFDASISLNDNLSKNFCKIPAKVRVSGDLIDHIDIVNKKKQPKASLDVELKKSNLKNIISFKLFIPKTKKEENFIIFHKIMSELKFIVPRSKYVDVKLNDNYLEKYLFVEKPSKEMIEYNKKKEGPIIAVDESNLWMKDNKTKNAYLVKLVNKKWASQNDITIRMSKEILDVMSLLYLEYHQRHSIQKENNIFDLNFSVLEDLGYKTKQIKRYNLALIAFNSQHGLHPNNRKYFFDPLNKEIHPISNDEDPLFIPYTKKFINENKFFIDFSEYENFIFDLRKLDKEKIIREIIESGVTDMNLNKLNYIISTAEKNLELFKTGYKEVKLKKSEFTNYYENNEIYLNDKNFFSKFSENKLILEECDKMFKNCKEITKDNNYISRVFSNKIKNSKYITDKNFYSNYSFVNNFNINFKKLRFNNGEILFNNDIDFLINKDKKIITINQSSIDGRIVFNSVDLTDYRIIFKGIGNIKNKDNQIRYTKDNLTGCLNFFDSRFKNTKLESYDTVCEDSINIINSTGDINAVKINNTLYDGLDIDFSDLIFKDINISNSENDCLDMSYGNYLINNIITMNCFDKSISLGEKSNLEIFNFNNSNSKVGLAVKDSSYSKIHYIKNMNTENCILAYRKKREFSGGGVSVKNSICDNNSYYVDDQSSLSINNDF